MIYQMAGQGVSVLTTTHYMDEAEFCNVIGMMYHSRLIALSDPDSLRESVIGVLFEVDCQEPSRAESVLKDLPIVQDVATHGVLLHVQVASEKQRTELEQTLHSNGIVVERIERVLPSLEDIFVSLVNQENRQRIRVDKD
jgi:ABC-2 type transport system ATP-binding protein